MVIAGATLVVPEDLVVTPCSDVRRDAQGEPGLGGDGYVLTRPRRRTRSSVVDRPTLELLECFRTPTTIIDAILQYCGSCGADPTATLEESFSALQLFVADGFLVAEPSATGAAGTQRLQPGDMIGDVTVLEPVSVLADTEVHRGVTVQGRRVAVKLPGLAPTPASMAAIAIEAAALARLDGGENPGLVTSGTVSGLPYVISVWCDGVDLARAAAEFRTLSGTESHRGLLDLVRALVAAYARLHAVGVLHGDVHPRNGLVDADGRVLLIDFGLAVLPGTPPGPAGGIDVFLAPELVEAMRSGAAAVRPTPASEQYAVAALAYFCLTGRHVRVYSLRQQEMWSQVLESEPDRFAAHGLTGLDEIEAWVLRGLRKSPQDRFCDLAEMLAALDRAIARTPLASAAKPPACATALMSRFLQISGQDPRRLPPPAATVAYGAAGVAYALLRIACAQQNPDLLAQADVWSSTAVDGLRRRGGRWSVRLGIDPMGFGRSSLLYHAAGVHAVQALVALARGDPSTALAATRSLIAACGRADREDLAFGRAGLLAALALVAEATPTGSDAALRAAGDRLATQVAAALPDAWHAGPGQPVFLGAAHGVAGRVHGLLRWCEVAHRPPPRPALAALDRLAALAVPSGRGFVWPRMLGKPPERSVLVASWCNGAAGHAMLWALAARIVRHPRAEELARGAAWAALEEVPDAPGDLCCGLAGRAYALLAMRRMTGAVVWSERALQMAERAAAIGAPGPRPIHGLLHGEAGPAMLTAEIQAGAAVDFPLFG